MSAESDQGHFVAIELILAVVAVERTSLREPRAIFVGFVAIEPISVAFVAVEPTKSPRAADYALPFRINRWPRLCSVCAHGDFEVVGRAARAGSGHSRGW